MQEKREGILGLLRMTGLCESAYWLAWLVNLCVLNAVLALGFAIACVCTSVPEERDPPSLVDRVKKYCNDYYKM